MARRLANETSCMIDAKFISGSCEGTVGCLAEADVNQSGGNNPTCDDISIGDITILINYLFITWSVAGAAGMFAKRGVA